MVSNVPPHHMVSCATIFLTTDNHFLVATTTLNCFSQEPNLRSPHSKT